MLSMRNADGHFIDRRKLEDDKALAPYWEAGLSNEDRIELAKKDRPRDERHIKD